MNEVDALLGKVFKYVDVRALVAGYESACAHGDLVFARQLEGQICVELSGPFKDIDDQA